MWLSSGNGYEGFVDWLDILKRQASTEVASVWDGGSEAIDRWFEEKCLPAVEKALTALVKKRTGWARAEELKRLEQTTNRSQLRGDTRGSAEENPTVPGVSEGDRQEPQNSEKPSPSRGAQSGALGIRLRGPDDMELLIVPYDDGYVWHIRNGQLQAIERIRFEILGVQSFDAEKAAFREATIAFRAYWTPIYKLLSGELTKGVIFVAFEGDGLRLGQTAGMNSLSWPSGDPSTARRWLLKMRVVGLSREWPIKLDLRWTVGTKTLALLEHRGDKAEDSDPPALHSKGERAQGIQHLSQESHAAARSDVFDFSSEVGRNKAIADYTDHWTTEQRTCSEASLARSATVDPADLSRWKKGHLPADSDKKSRIEKVLRNNQKPTPSPKKLADR
jgi:hypothetical protein